MLQSIQDALWCLGNSYFLSEKTTSMENMDNRVIRTLHESLVASTSMYIYRSVKPIDHDSGKESVCGDLARLAG